MNLNGCFTELNIRESASRSTRERHEERPNQRNGPPSFGSRRRWPCSFWKRSTGCLCDVRVAENTDGTARRRGAHRREVDLEVAPHDAFVLNWQRKRVPERWF